jgi:hypothetical protein
MPDWLPIASVPDGRNIEVAVIDRSGTHALTTPCVWRDGLWSDAATGRVLEIWPTHWREIN